MSSANKNLSKFEFAVPSAKGLSFGIVAASWNSNVTDALLEGAINTLVEAGAKKKDIMVKRVPGAYELTMGAQLMCEHTNVDAVIVLGAIVKGGTPHFDFIAQGVTQGINAVALEYNTPIAFGVLTTNNMEEAVDRAGGKFGNKGEEAAATAIVMAKLKMEMEENAE